MLFRAEGMIYCVGFWILDFKGFGYPTAPGALGIASVYQQSMWWSGEDVSGVMGENESGIGHLRQE